jgi:hypothetical protein
VVVVGRERLVYPVLQVALQEMAVQVLHLPLVVLLLFMLEGAAVVLSPRRGLVV